MTDKTISKKIEKIKKSKLASRKIVSLEEFRVLRDFVNSKTILVVDDDEIMRNALSRICESEKYSVLTAGDGLELSKILESTRLDLILLDVKLPWVDGFEVCRIIKQHHTMKHVPVIFVSGLKSDDDIQKGFDAGCDEYVTKPFDVTEITDTIRRSLAE